MLLNADQIINCPVLSLHVSGMVAKTNKPIIDREKLQIVAFYVVGPEVGKGEFGDILRISDIREYSSLGMVIDSIDELVTADEIVKLSETIHDDFDIIGMKVETKKKTKLGKVSSYTISPEDFRIQQIVVQRPLMKSFLDPELTISRNEIVKVEDDKIIIRDEEQKIKERAKKEDFIPNFVNPFREQRLSPAESRTLDESDK